MRQMLEHGGGHGEVELPGRRPGFRAETAHHETPSGADPVAATVAARDIPLGCAPIPDLVRANEAGSW